MSAAKVVAVPIVAKAVGNDLFSVTSTREILSSTHTEELVIALCGPIGSPLHEVAEKLGEMLKQPFGYSDCNVIRLSQFIQKHAETSNREVSTGLAKRVHDVGTIAHQPTNFGVFA